MVGYPRYIDHGWGAEESGIPPRISFRLYNLLFVNHSRSKYALKCRLHILFTYHLVGLTCGYGA